jgi:hypothetical protein
MISATAPPATPSRGNGPQPRIRQGDSGTRITVRPTLTPAGTTMFPVPRMTLAKALNTQIKTIPAKTMSE